MSKLVEYQDESLPERKHKLTEKRLKFIRAARDLLGDSATTITRKEILEVIEKNSELKYPGWLHKYPTGDRGVYFIPDEHSNVTKPVATPAAMPAASVAMVPSNVAEASNSENYIPKKFDGYVAFGNYKTVSDVVKSKKFFPTFISGMSGNGKTLMVKEVCARLKREFIRANITIETDEDDLLGGFRLIGGETVWSDGPVITAMKRGAILLLDEIDLASNKILCLQPVLEGSAIHLKKTGETVYPKPGFNVIATANTKGQGDDGQYIGTNLLNEAFLERFAITFEQEYPSKAVEEKIINHEFSKDDIVDTDFSSKLVEWARIIRATFAEGACNDIISTRRLVHIVKAFSITGNKLKSIELAVNRFDSETKESFINLYSKLDAGITEDDPTSAEDENLEGSGSTNEEGVPQGVYAPPHEN